MRIWRYLLIPVLLAATAQPCSVAYVPRLWAKQPGAPSSLFAFEENGLVGFIDARGEKVIKPFISESIENVGDFEDGLARVAHKGYIDESGRWVLRREV